LTKVKVIWTKSEKHCWFNKFIIFTFIATKCYVWLAGTQMEFGIVIKDIISLIIEKQCQINNLSILACMVTKLYIAAT